MKHLRLPLGLLSLVTVTSLCGVLPACSSASTADPAPAEPAAPVDPGAEGPGPGAADGGADAPVAPAVAPGAVDPSYGTKGVVTGTDSNTPTIRFSRDGRAVIFAHKTNRYAEATVLLASGKPDATYGSGGEASVMIPGAIEHSQALNASARIGEDGIVLVSGGMKQGGNYWSPFVARLSGSSLDLTFAQNGMWTFYDAYAVVTNLVVERDAGGAVKGYYVTVDLSSLGDVGGTPRAASTRIYHLSATGAADPAFVPGKGYYESTSYPSIVLDSTGLPVLYAKETATSYYVRRLTKAGAVDGTYGTGGSTIVSWPGHESVSVSSQALAKGGVMFAIASRTNDASETRIVRLDAKGAVVDAFPGSPTRDIAGAETRFAGELADGRLLVSRTDTAYNETVERWLADGKPDAAFGKAGTVSITAIAGADTNLYDLGLTSTGATMLATSKSVSGNTEWSVRRLAP